MENKQNYSLLPRFILPRYQYVVDTFISIGIVAFIIGKIYKDQDTKSTSKIMFLSIIKIQPLYI